MVIRQDVSSRLQDPLRRDRRRASRAFRCIEGGAIALLGAALLLPISGTARAQSMGVYNGVIEVRPGGNRAGTWSVDYREPLAGPLDVGLLYLNEGHPPGHHRDGIAAELWLRGDLADGRVSLAIGGGPYYFFDTARRGSNDYLNLHGWGTVYSALAEWRVATRWSLLLRADRVTAPGSFDSRIVVLGVGYRWGTRLYEDEPVDGPAPAPARTLTVLHGRTVVNSFDSEQSSANAIEYRQGLRRWLEWTATWISEGDTRLVRRNGAASQLWLVRWAHDDRVTLGVGAGPYVAIDHRNPPGITGTGARLAGLVTIGAKYELLPQLHARLAWNRVLATYHRDTDVFMLGLGYAF